jgi:hypothetical protein
VIFFFLFRILVLYIFNSYISFYRDNLDDAKFENFIQSQGLTIKDNVVIINTNYDNEAKPTVIRENIKFERMLTIIYIDNRIIVD